MIPPRDAARSAHLRVMMPQFALPGEARLPVRDLPFVHRFHVPEDADGSVLVLLHGSGGNEADLMPFAHRVSPRATLLGVRGRSTEEGVFRWFRRLGEGAFDQGDIRSEAEAFEAFVDRAVAGYGLDRARLGFLGYSNGANFLAAVLRLCPGVVRRALLLRPSEVLEEAPAADLTGTDILMVAGTADPLGADPSGLQQALEAAGAAVEAHGIAAGHELGAEDEALARAWLMRG